MLALKLRSRLAQLPSEHQTVYRGSGRKIVAFPSLWGTSKACCTAQMTNSDASHIEEHNSKRSEAAAHTDLPILTISTSTNTSLAAACPSTSAPESSEPHGNVSTSPEIKDPQQPWTDVTLGALQTHLADFASERDWEQYHTPRNLLLALVGETGELAELFQWRSETDAGPRLPGYSTEQRGAVADEMADVLLYLVRLADVCGVDLGAAALAKLQKNAVKYPAARCRGSSAKYTSYVEGATEGSREVPQQQQQQNELE